MSENEKTLDDSIYKKIVALSRYGDKLANSRRYDEAIEKYKEALRYLPKPYEKWDAATWIYVAIGDARFKQKHFQKALNCFSNAIHCPTGLGNPFIHLRLGQCEFELNNKDRAAEELARAYMGAGEEIFLEDDIKYLSFIKSRLLEQ